MSGLIHERTPEQQAVDALVLARVKRGIALLEKWYGPTWIDRITLEELNLENGSCCVLGQVYGSYNRGCDACNLVAFAVYDGYEHTVEAGFAASYEGENMVDGGYDALQEVWERELTVLGVPQ